NLQLFDDALRVVARVLDREADVLGEDALVGIEEPEREVADEVGESLVEALRPRINLAELDRLGDRDIAADAHAAAEGEAGFVGTVDRLPETGGGADGQHLLVADIAEVEGFAVLAGRKADCDGHHGGFATEFAVDTGQPVLAERAD